MIEVTKLPRMPERPRQAHKGTCGRVLVLAGSKGMTGAATLTAQSALRAGAGLVLAATPDSQQPILAAKLTCGLTRGLADTGEGAFARAATSQALELTKAADAVVLGPGIGLAAETADFVCELLPQIECPTLVDADALTILADRLDVLHRAAESGPLVLTPHPGEMSRLVQRPVPEIQADRSGIAGAFAAAHGVVLVLKGYQTVVTDGQRVFVNQTGNLGMATGGSGDVLSGVVAALLAAGMEAFDAAQLGVHVHGLAGDVAAERLGEVSMIATDILASLPDAFRQVV